MRQIVLLLLALVTTAGNAVAEADVHWMYSGQHGPEHWGELSEAFAACSEGKSQSPIDIVESLDTDLDPIVLAYSGSTTAVVNNGHTLQINAGPDNSLELDGQKFDLLQFHLHSPSEHRIRRESFALEVHFVHKNDRSELAVLAVLFREGAQSGGIATIEASAPAKAGMSEALDVRIASLGIVPENTAHYSLSGLPHHAAVYRRSPLVAGRSDRLRCPGAGAEVRGNHRRERSRPPALEWQTGRQLIGRFRTGNSGGFEPRRPETGDLRA